MRIFPFGVNKHSPRPISDLQVRAFHTHTFKSISVQSPVKYIKRCHHNLAYIFQNVEIRRSRWQQGHIHMALVKSASSADIFCVPLLHLHHIDHMVFIHCHRIQPGLPQFRRDTKFFFRLPFAQKRDLFTHQYADGCLESILILHHLVKQELINKVHMSQPGLCLLNCQFGDRCFLILHPLCRQLPHRYLIRHITSLRQENQRDSLPGISYTLLLLNYIVNFKAGFPDRKIRTFTDTALGRETAYSPLSEATP